MTVIGYQNMSINKPLLGCLFFVFSFYTSALFSSELEPVLAKEGRSETSQEQLDLVALAQHYPLQDMDGMIELLIAKGDKRRVMIKPYQLRFEGELMAAPKSGSYSLIYDSLKLWGLQPLPNVTHASYIKTPGNKVMPVYLDESAAKRLSDEPVGMKATFYALHVYNYEHGPRLLILSYQTSLTTNSFQTP